MPKGLTCTMNDSLLLLDSLLQSRVDLALLCHSPWAPKPLLCASCLGILRCRLILQTAL